MQHDVVVHVEGDGAAVRAGEPAGRSARPAPRGSAAPGRPSSGHLAEQTQDHRLDAAVTVAGGTERAEQLGADGPARPRAARPPRARSRTSCRPHRADRVRAGRSDADGEEVEDAQRHEGLLLVLRAGVDDPVREVAGKGRPHDDPEARGGVVPNDEHHTGQREQGLQAGSLRRDLGVEVGGAPVSQQVPRPRPAERDRGALCGDVDHRSVPGHGCLQRVRGGRSASGRGHHEPLVGAQPEHRHLPRRHRRAGLLRHRHAQHLRHQSPAGPAGSSRRSSCTSSGSSRTRTPAGRDSRRSAAEASGLTRARTGKSSQPSRRLPSLSNRTLSVTVTGTTRPRWVRTGSGRSAPGRERPAPGRTSGRAPRCGSSTSRARASAPAARGSVGRSSTTWRALGQQHGRVDRQQPDELLAVRARVLGAG